MAKVGCICSNAGAEGVERGCDFEGLVIGSGVDGGGMECDGGVGEGGADWLCFCLGNYYAVGGGVGDGFGYAGGERVARHFGLEVEGVKLLFWL